MGKNIVEKIIEIHKLSGEYKQGEKISISVDSILTNDALGVLTFLQAEKLTDQFIELEGSLCTIDHTNVEIDPKAIEIQRYLQFFCYKNYINFSRAGNGISHMVYLERFARPGYILLGNDEHTSIGGAVSMLAFTSSGADLAVVMAALPYYINVPKVFRVEVKGTLQPFVSSKDVALYLCKKNSFLDLSDTILEFGGVGIENLDIYDRATIASFASELGCLSIIFPSDNIVKEYLKKQGREFDFVEILPDKDANYDDYFELDLSAIVPLAARPHSPLNIVEITNIEETYIDQVVIGGCTSSSYKDFWKVAKILEGKTVARNLSLIICPSSKQILSMLARDGILTKLIESGARIIEPSCGVCLGLINCPPSKGKSLRTFNKNTKGLCGTKDGEVYIVSPETASVSALYGRIIDPRSCEVNINESFDFFNFIVDDRMIIPSVPENKDNIISIKSTGVKAVPLFEELKNEIDTHVILKLPDNIDILDMVNDNKEAFLFCGDIYKTAEILFKKFDSNFYSKAKNYQNSIIVAGENYGQTTFYEHIALALRYLGIFAIIAKSFKHSEKKILINAGILPLVFENKLDYNRINPETKIMFRNIKEALLNNKKISVNYENQKLNLKVNLDNDELEIIFSGGKIKYFKEKFIDKKK